MKKSISLTILIMLFLVSCFATGDSLHAVSTVPDAPPPITDIVQTSILPILAYLIFMIFKISYQKVLRVLHMVWDIIIDTDLFFKSDQDSIKNKYLDKANGSLPLAKKIYSIEQLNALPIKEKSKILKYFGSIPGAIESAFSFFKLGKKLYEVLR